MLKETFRLASRTEGSATARLIDAIIRERPELAHETFYVPGKGKSNCAVLTEKEVFKVIQTVDEDGMPLYDAGLESQLQSYLYAKGLEVPEVTCIDRQGEFFGMKRFEGTRLSLLDISRREALEDIHYQIGKFIADVETASLSPDFDHIRHTMVSTSENSMAIQAAGLLKSRKLRQAMNNPALIALLSDQADKILKAPSVLIHDDLHGSNVLLKSDGKCTFIDFGCAHMAHSVYTEIGMGWKEESDAILKGYVENQKRRSEADLICEHLLHEMILNSKNNLAQWCQKDMPALVERLQKLGALPAAEQKCRPPKSHPRPKR